MFADAETQFGLIAGINCYPGDLDQALLNMVVNAAHAIEDAARATAKKGLIRVETRQDKSQVPISI